MAESNLYVTADLLQFKTNRIKLEIAPFSPKDAQSLYPIKSPGK